MSNTQLSFYLAVDYFKLILQGEIPSLLILLFLCLPTMVESFQMRKKLSECRKGRMTIAYMTVVIVTIFLTFVTGLIYATRFHSVTSDALEYMRTSLGILILMTVYCPAMCILLLCDHYAPKTKK